MSQKNDKSTPEVKSLLKLHRQTLKDIRVKTGVQTGNSIPLTNACTCGPCPSKIHAKPE